MFSAIQRRITYANVAATLALVFSMTGGALAAKHYLINSTKQINPKVLKKLKGKNGKNGTNGAIGPAGPAGAAGAAGAVGPAGPNGVVAAYAASVPGSVTLGEGEAPEHTSATVLTKAIGAGNYIVNAKVELGMGVGLETKGSGRVTCTLTDTPTSGSPVSDTSDWFAAANVPDFLFGVAQTTIPLSLNVSTGAATSTLALKCEVEFATSGEAGKTITVFADHARLNAVQATSIS